MKKHYIIFTIALLIFPTLSSANNCIPDPVCTDTTVTCLELTLQHGPDPEGRGLRYEARFNLLDSLTVLFLQGPIRWFVDGVAVGDSEVVSMGGAAGGVLDHYSILRVEDLSSINATPASVITARYIGDEQYDSTNLDPPYGVAFEASECQADILALNQKTPWGVSITVDKTEIEFTDTVEATATWDSVDFDQNVLTGRLTLLRNNGNVLGEGSVAEKTGTIYHPKVKFSTLGLGQHTFEASYLGVEGALTLAASETVTVRPPRRPLILQMESVNFVTKGTENSSISVCAGNRDGNLPTGIGGREIQFTITPQDTTPALTPIVTTFNPNGCAQITVPSLAPGKYSIDSAFSTDDRFRASKSSDIITLVPEVTPAVINPDMPAVIGTATVTTSFIAPAQVDLTGISPAINYEVLPPGLVFQAEVLPDNFTLQQPTGGLLLLINGQLITLRKLELSSSGFIGFGPFNMPPGEYTATLAYTGDDNYAPYISGNIVFSIDPSGVPSFSPQPEMQQEFAGVNNDFELSLSLNVNRLYVDGPVILTGSLRPVENATPNKGIPVGSMVFKNGSEVLGTVQLSGFSGSIRLPSGLPTGFHDLSVEYEE